ncbi:hypothetical protein DICVIV_08909 [Dictyocaulus viviparus]|uniref:Uncharacterized protein n=1 Tax=Dictyocaulus viviparus TaxID=29172 RepID=A0A0D8XMM8_DICVI|nr:hypothetical protein DICVIV_08909 [Dictyocaulus viviparus]
MQGSGPSLQHKYQAGPSSSSQMVPCGSPCSMQNNVSSQQVPSLHTMVGVAPQPNHPSCMQSVNVQSPLQSPMNYQLQNYGYPNNSPMQSPLGSPLSSCLMLEERMTPMMELSPPNVHDPCSESASLPNLQHQTFPPHQQPPQFYHQTIGQRHSTSGAIITTPRLTPAAAQTSESQSAPTSPANNLDPSQHLQWSEMRTFSNSPESLDIPRLVLTNPEGANRPHMECFNEQHLELGANNMQMLCNGVTNGSPLNQVYEEFSIP